MMSKASEDNKKVRDAAHALRSMLRKYLKGKPITKSRRKSKKIKNKKVKEPEAPPPKEPKPKKPKTKAAPPVPKAPEKPKKLPNTRVPWVKYAERLRRFIIETKLHMQARFWRQPSAVSDRFDEYEAFDLTWVQRINPIWVGLLGACSSSFFDLPW